MALRMSPPQARGGHTHAPPIADTHAHADPRAYADTLCGHTHARSQSHWVCVSAQRQETKCCVGGRATLRSTWPLGSNNRKDKIHIYLNVDLHVYYYTFVKILEVNGSSLTMQIRNKDFCASALILSLDCALVCPPPPPACGERPSARAGRPGPDLVPGTSPSQPAPAQPHPVTWSGRGLAKAALESFVSGDTWAVSVRKRLINH